MKIWLISIGEQTPIDNAQSTRFLNIADEALKRNHQIDFYASTFKHNTKNQRFQETTEIKIAENYKLICVKSDSYEKNISYKRLKSHYTFSKNLVKVLENKEKPDVIYVSFPPISLGLEMCKWAKKNGIPIIVDIIDPWPDLFEPFIPKLFRSLILSPLRKRVTRMFDASTAIASISNKYINWAKGYSDKITKTQVFYPAVKFKDMKSLIESFNRTDDNLFRIIYAGSLAQSYDIPCILKSAEILNESHKGKIEFVIAGAGPQDQMIKEYENRLDNVRFVGRLEKKDLMNLYAQSDLGTTQHIKGATQSVTYKLFDLLACGLPILNSLESEMKDIILDNEVGLHNDPHDFNQLTKNILHFYNSPDILNQYKSNGFKLTAKSGDSDVVYSRLIDYIEEVAQG